MNRLITSLRDCQSDLGWSRSEKYVSDNALQALKVSTNILKSIHWQIQTRSQILRTPTSGHDGQSCTKAKTIKIYNLKVKTHIE